MKAARFLYSTALTECCRTKALLVRSREGGFVSTESNEAVHAMARSGPRLSDWPHGKGRRPITSVAWCLWAPFSLQKPLPQSFL